MEKSAQRGVAAPAIAVLSAGDLNGRGSVIMVNPLYLHHLYKAQLIKVPIRATARTAF